MNEQLKPCPFCGPQPIEWAPTGLIKCLYSGCSSNPESYSRQGWNTRADGWISASINPQFSGRFTVDSSYGVRDAFFTEGFVSGDFRWQDCQTGDDEGMENYDGVEFKVYNWMKLPSTPKSASSCGE